MIYTLSVLYTPKKGLPMHEDDSISPPLTGTALEYEVLKGEHTHHPIVCDFLYEHAVLMVFATGGVGKSTLALQAGLEISAGVPVWGYLPVPKPRVVYYIQFERHKKESLERLKNFREKYNINYDNFWLDAELTHLNIEYKNDFNHIINRIKHFCKPDLVILDPIYGCVEGALSDEKPAKTIIRLSKSLQHEFDCSVWMNHHNPKDVINKDGDKVERDDPYGSRHFNSHVTIQYYLKKEGETGSSLNKQKDNWNVGIKRIPLNYDGEHQMSFIDEKVGRGFAVEDRVVKLLKECSTLNKKLTFAEIEQNLKGCATRSLRRVLADLAHPNIEKHKSIGHASLYSYRNLEAV